MARRIILGLQFFGLLLMLTTLTTVAHAGHNGVRVNSLAPAVNVLVYKTKQGKSFKVRGQRWLDASLTCSVSGFRVKSLGSPGINAMVVKKTHGNTRASGRWFLGKADLQPHFSKMVAACNAGQKSFSVNFLPPHACHRVKGIASAGSAVNQSKPLRINVECAAVNKTFYTLPNSSCDPVGPPRPTKTGKRVQIGCQSKVSIPPQPSGISLKYVETVSFQARRIQVPPGCKVPKQLEYQFRPLTGGKKEVTGVRVGLKCNKYTKATWPKRIVEGKSFEFVNSVDFGGVGIPVVALPKGCSQQSVHRFEGGRWVHVKCNKTHGSFMPVKYVEKGQGGIVFFGKKANFVIYHTTPGPLSAIPSGCIQHGFALGGGGKGKTAHTVYLVCTKNKKVPTHKMHGKARLSYKVKGRVPQGCTPLRMAGFTTVVSCKAPVVCKPIYGSTLPIACEEYD